MVIAIITAGGVGSRTHQNIPKQFITVNNKPIIIYTLEAFQAHPNIDYIYVSCLDGWTSILEAYANQFNITKLRRIVIGGATGQESIYNAMKAIHDDFINTKDLVVMIHDGNRPLISQDIITDNLVTQRMYGSAVAAIPSTEVVYVSKEGVSSTIALNREELWRAQTPNSYVYDELWDMHNKALNDGIKNMAACCSIMTHYNFPTFFSKGSTKNIRITTLDDIEIFKALLSTNIDNWFKK